MDQSGIHIGDVGKLLRRIVDDWRLDQKKSIRDMNRNFEDRLEKIDAREPSTGSEELKTQLREQFELYKGLMDNKHEMIDEAHRQMVEHLERCRQDAD